MFHRYLLAHRVKQGHHVLLHVSFSNQLLSSLLGQKRLTYRGLVSACLQQYISIALFVEADYHGLANPQRRRPQVSRRSEHGIDHVFGSFTARRELFEFLALGHNYPTRPSG